MHPCSSNVVTFDILRGSHSNAFYAFATDGALGGGSATGLYPDSRFGLTISAEGVFRTGAGRLCPAEFEGIHQQ